MDPKGPFSPDFKPLPHDTNRFIPYPETAATEYPLLPV
ncbi:hypothetical protein FLA_4943 [Filimonas lacunae]|nr:hypothetical protein FLA_4943 [Filimonas lacunae]